MKTQLKAYEIKASKRPEFAPYVDEIKKEIKEMQRELYLASKTMMKENVKWGGIVGDVLGSVYENPYNPFKTDDPSSIDLTRDDVFFTDDTVLSVAAMDSIMHGRSWEANLEKWANRYPRCGFGSQFKFWLAAKGDERNQFRASKGNGAAMRIWPIALLDLTLPDIYSAVEQNAICTHNSDSALFWTKIQASIVKSAYSIRATSDEEAIQLFKEEQSKATANGETFSIPPPCGLLDKIRPDIVFSSLAFDTVPLAYECVLESTSFESAIQNAISMGSDTDTVASMAGAVAGALYGVPQELVDFVRKKLTLEMVEIIEAFDLISEKTRRDAQKTDVAITMFGEYRTD